MRAHPPILSARIRVAALSLLVAAALTACTSVKDIKVPELPGAAATLKPNPNPPVPPLQAETRPLPPISDKAQIWQPGHWDWTGTAYVWSPGLWVESAGHGTQYQQGAWTVQGTDWVWVPAHWL